VVIAPGLPTAFRAVKIDFSGKGKVEISPGPHWGCTPSLRGEYGFELRGTRLGGWGKNSLESLGECSPIAICSDKAPLLESLKRRKTAKEERHRAGPNFQSYAARKGKKSWVLGSETPTRGKKRTLALLFGFVFCPRKKKKKQQITSRRIKTKQVFVGGVKEWGTGGAAFWTNGF